MGTGEEGVKGCVGFSAPGGGPHGDVEGFPNVGALTKLGHGRDAHATGVRPAVKSATHPEVKPGHSGALSPAWRPD